MAFVETRKEVRALRAFLLARAVHEFFQDSKLTTYAESRCQGIVLFGVGVGFRWGDARQSCRADKAGQIVAGPIAKVTRNCEMWPKLFVLFGKSASAAPAALCALRVNKIPDGCGTARRGTSRNVRNIRKGESANQLRGLRVRKKPPTHPVPPRRISHTFRTLFRPNLW